MINGIVRQLESQGDADIPTDRIGELVMEGLKALDDVAYVRFASVYRNFREARDFQSIVGELESTPAGEPERHEAPPAMSGPGDDDARWMDAALALGRRGLGFTAPNPSVGALIVKDGVVVGRGVTSRAAARMPNGARSPKPGEAARGATLYVTLEPCSHHGVTPPCAEAVIEAGVARVVSAIEDPTRGSPGAATGCCARPASRSSSGSARRRRGATIAAISARDAGRPMVTLKIARTADGYAAGDEHDRRLVITGEAANARVQVLRSMHDAIMVGVGTALIDDPLLTVRLPGAAGEAAARRGRFRAAAAAASRLAATAARLSDPRRSRPTPRRPTRQALQARGLDVIASATAEGRVDLAAALAALGARGVTRVFSRGRAARRAPNSSRHGLADEVTLITAPKPLGRPGLPALDSRRADAARRPRRLCARRSLAVRTRRVAPPGPAGLNSRR